jgi:Thioredoxin
MKEYIEKAMTFAEYAGLIDGLLADGKTTGANQSEALFGYAKLNKQRMQRLEKTVELNEGVLKAAKSLDRKIVWLILTEGWCGDAAQNLPVIEKIAAESVNIETRYLLRDEHLELMDSFLIGGSRSIPKLIALYALTHEVLGSWGARPNAAQELFLEMKSRGLEKPLILENMQRWYNADKSESIQAEFETLLKEWNGRSKAKANC